jgi:peptidoglycan/LPS O-acetylase OafA/YrhL
MAEETAGTVYKHSSSSEFRNLDLLRAIAVLSVFLGHLLLFLIKVGLLSVSRPGFGIFL